MKQGRFSKTELKYIEDNALHRSYVDIAKDLDRDRESIKSRIEKLGMEVTLSVESHPALYTSDIRSRQFWPELQQQFSTNELNHFQYEWDQIRKQFKEDILPTEELQIIDAIKLGIFMNRASREMKSSAEAIQDLEDAMNREKSLGEDADKTNIAFMERQLSFHRSAQGALGKEYRELQDRKNKMFEALKATRAARITRVESSKESFTSWLQEIINNPDRRRELGIRMEKMRLAIIDEKIRLAAYHKYEDGKIDQPLLNAETVKDDNK